MVNRLLGIIYILLNKGTVTAGELAERFEVSARTIYRDVENLSMAGIPVYARKGKCGGISLTEQFVLDKMIISPEEQQRILAALASVGEAGAQEEGKILRKLGDFFKAEPDNWVSIDFSDWSGRRKELFVQIKEAILHRNVLEFDYYGQSGEMSSRRAEPVQLLFKDYTWYVRALCRTRKAMRMFKVLRMKRVRVLDETFEADGSRMGRPGTDWGIQESGAEASNISGDIQKDVGEIQKADGEILEGGGEIQKADGGDEKDSGGMGKESEKYLPQISQILLRIDKKEAYRIYDRFEEEEITVLPSGDFEVRMTCLVDDWIYGLILSFGPSARVLEPAYVREELGGRIRRMAEMYS